MSKEYADQIFRVVCVVNNLDETLANWKEMVEFNEDSIKLESDENGVSIVNGEEVPCKTRSARFDLGGVDMMLVEPLDKEGKDTYSVTLRERGQGFHHIGVYSSEKSTLADRYQEAGFAPVVIKSGDGSEMNIYNFEHNFGMQIELFDQMTGPCGPRDAEGKTR